MSKIFQDWEPVILKKTVKKINSQSNISNNNPVSSIKIYNDNDDINPDIIPKTITLEYGKKIQQARNTLKITQKELAQKLNITVDIIKKYESGEGIKNGNIITKINRFLNITNKA